MTKRYTAADFANARFAEHADGDFAGRTYPHESDQWWSEREFAYTDEQMANDGWVPVTTKPTITRKSYDEAVEFLGGERDKYAFDNAFRVLGIEIPDPEPTNTERLEQLLSSYEGYGMESTFGKLAAHLNDHGVTAPNVKGN